MARIPSEADIIFNKANVALAKSQRLLASWLPPRNPEELQNTKTEEELEREEREMFVPMPETLGVGAMIPTDGEVKREELSSNEKLRRQLLGKDWEKKLGRRKREDGESKSRPSMVGSKPRPANSKKVEKDSDEEPGRSALGKSRRKAERKLAGQPDDTAREDAVLPPSTSTDVRPMEDSRGSKRQSNNYLDEVLADRSRKKHKKGKKKQQNSVIGSATSPNI